MASATGTSMPGLRAFRLRQAPSKKTRPEYSITGKVTARLTHSRESTRPVRHATGIAGIQPDGVHHDLHHAQARNTEPFQSLPAFNSGGRVLLHWPVGGEVYSPTPIEERARVAEAGTPPDSRRCVCNPWLYLPVPH